MGSSHIVAQKMDPQERRRRWADMLPELLHSVASRLDCIGTYVTFACVCRSWRDAAKAAAGEFMRSQPPVLVHFLSPMAQSDALHFYDLLGKKGYRKHIEGFSELRFVRHSCGWLIMRDQSEAVVLLNPFTGARIEISAPLKRKGEHVVDALLSEPPTSSECCWIFLMTNCSAHYRRVGSTSTTWTSVPRESRDARGSLLQLLFIKNIVYAVDRRGIVTAMTVSDCGGGAGSISCFPSAGQPLCDAFKRPFPRIIEIGGQLWVIDMNSDKWYRLDQDAGWTRAEPAGKQCLFVSLRGCRAYDATTCRKDGMIWHKKYAVQVWCGHGSRKRRRRRHDRLAYRVYLNSLPASPVSLQSDQRRCGRMSSSVRTHPSPVESELIHFSYLTRDFTNTVDFWLPPDACI